MSHFWQQGLAEVLSRGVSIILARFLTTLPGKTMGVVQVAGGSARGALPQK